MVGDDGEDRSVLLFPSLLISSHLCVSVSPVTADCGLRCGLRTAESYKKRRRTTADTASLITTSTMMTTRIIDT